mmetsp:Transcript_13238/g.22061  ORF Transcript_13238/g.22061 Transcript_13238/m.22061 type:complete len:1105 (-) Transcript_13238:224-3538(-)
MATSTKSLKNYDPTAKKVEVREVKMTYGPGYDLTPKVKKKKKNLENVMPTGIDDGKGARRLLHSYVEEVCKVEKKTVPHNTINYELLSEDFKQQSFVDQVNHVQMNSITQLSHMARQNCLFPKNSTNKKRHYIHYAQRLKQNDTTLLRARLSSEALDDTIIKILENGLKKNTILEHLQLHQNSITDAGIEIICTALRWHPALHTIWLGANRFSDIGARHLSLLLKRNHIIKELNISNRWPNEIWHKHEYDQHPHVSYIGAQYFATVLQQGSGLTSLSLADQRVRDAGAKYLFAALKSSNLRVLNISSNELSNRCCRALRKALELNPAVEQLVLSHNTISDEGAVHIAFGLAKNRHLKVMDLGYNQIDNDGLEALFLCLKYNTTLDSMITVRNIGDDRRAEDAVSRRLQDGQQAEINFSSYAYIPGQAVEVLPMDRVPGVEILGKSLHSRSFRHLLLDSRPSTVAQSFNKSMRNSFFGLSDMDGDIQSFAEDAAGHDLHRDRVASPPAPMLGSLASSSGNRSTSKKERTSSPVGNTMFWHRTSTPDSQDSSSSSIDAAAGGSKRDKNNRKGGGSRRERRERRGRGRRNKGKDGDDGGSSGDDNSSPMKSNPSAAAVGANAADHAANPLASTTSYPSLLSTTALTRLRAAVPPTIEESLKEDMASGKSNLPASAKSTAAEVTTVTVALREGEEREDRGGGRGGGESDDGNSSRSSSASVSRGSSAHKTRRGGRGRGGSSNSIDNSDDEDKKPAPMLGKLRSRAHNTNGINSRGSNNSGLGGSYREKYDSFRVRTEAKKNEMVDTLAQALKAPPAVVTDPGPRVKSRDIGKTMSIPSLKNMGVRPIRSSISRQKDSAQHLLYLRVATPFDAPGDRPYSILNIGRDHQNEIARVRKERQDPVYIFEKAFHIKNTPPIIKHQAALPKVPQYFWDAWQKKTRLQYHSGIDNATGVTSTKLEPLQTRASTSISEKYRQNIIADAAVEDGEKGAGEQDEDEEEEDEEEEETANDGDEKSKQKLDSSTTSVVASGASSNPSSAYYNVTKDPSQAFRRHLRWKTKNLTPGKILAARRKENMIQKKLREDEQQRLETLAASGGGAAGGGHSTIIT